MLELNTLYQNPVLFGHDATPGLVAVEKVGAGELKLFYREKSQEGKPGALREEAGNLEPFVLLNDPELVSDAPVPTRLETLAGPGAYQTLARADDWKSLELLLKHLKKRTGTSSGNPTGPYYVVNDEVAQYLLLSGRTMFKGLAYNDIHRLQLDLEALCTPGFDFPNASREADRIIIITLSDNFGWECTLSGQELGEKALLEAMVARIRERDPDVIEGHNLFKFDLPFLEARARRHKVSLALGRDGSKLSSHSSRFNAGERSIPYPKYEIFGRHVVDTLFLALLHDVTFRDLESFGLKDIARHFGLAPENRTYVDGGKIGWAWEHEPEKLLAYALDDVRETRGVAELLGRSWFFQTQIFPLSYQNVVVRGNATRIDLLFLREYLRQRQAVPVCPPGRPLEGGYTDMLVQGVVRQVAHVDIRSLYPSLMVAFEILPRSDTLEIFPRMLRDLRSFRLEAKDALRRARTPQERDAADALQSTFKVLINSFFGYLGFDNGHFADFQAAARVTAKGRELLKQMMGWLQGEGAQVIEIDTDGIYFVTPAGRTPESLLEGLNQLLPQGIEAELDGQYEGMFSYKVKNYVLMEAGGRLRIKGSGLRSRSLERFQRKLMEEIFTCLLHGTAPLLGEIYRRYVEELKGHRWDVGMFSRRETLQDSPATYQQEIKEKKRTPAAAYELALASGREYQAGDQVVFYVTGTKKGVKVYEAARLASAWRAEAPDENVPYYLAKLEEIYARFEPFIVEAGGPELKSLK